MCFCEVLAVVILLLVIFITYKTWTKPKSENLKLPSDLRYSTGSLVNNPQVLTSGATMRFDSSFGSSDQ